MKRKNLKRTPHTEIRNRGHTARTEQEPGAPNENIIQNHLNIALFKVF